MGDGTYRKYRVILTMRDHKSRLAADKGQPGSQEGLDKTPCFAWQICFHLSPTIPCPHVFFVTCKNRREYLDDMKDLMVSEMLFRVYGKFHAGASSDQFRSRWLTF